MWHWHFNVISALVCLQVFTAWTLRGSCCLYGSGHEVLLASGVLYHTSRSAPVPGCLPLGWL